MNRPMLFSLGILILLAFVSFISNGNLTGDSFTTNTSGSATIDSNTSTYESAGGSGSFDFNLFSGMGLIATLTLLVAAGILAGIGLFGSGLSDTSQVLIVKGVGFLGLWTALSLFASPLIISDSGIYGILIYSGISLLFGIGFVFDVAGSGA